MTLKNKSDISGSHWIEFNISGSLNNFEHWADNSKYLEEYAYNFYSDIFEKVADDFNYYGATRFTSEQVKGLKLEFESRIKELESFNTLKDFIAFSNKLSYAVDLKLKIEETYYKQYAQRNVLLNEIRNLGNELDELFDYCISQVKTLWVLGL